MANLRGINLAMQTPMHADGSIDARVGIDLIGYNIPQTTGIAVSLELFRRLNQLDHFNHIKDSSGDLTTHQEYIASGHPVLNGCDPNTLFALIAGAQGCIWGGANYMPVESVRLFELVDSGDLAAAIALWARMLPSLLHIWRGNYIPRVKAASRLRGFDGGAVRAPLRDLDTAGVDELASHLKPLDQE